MSVDAFSRPLRHEQLKPAPEVIERQGAKEVRVRFTVAVSYPKRDYISFLEREVKRLANPGQLSNYARGKGHA